MKIRILLSILLLTVLLPNIAIVLVRAQPQTHNADAMWIEPSSTVYNYQTNGTVGSTFNVTVWLNMTENIYAYQIGLHYNRTQLMCTRSDFTGSGGKSNYFAGHTTTPAGPLIDTSSLGNGSVAAGESLSGNTDKIPGPKNASLIWIEFKVLMNSSSGNLTSSFDITTETPANNFVLDPDLNNINITPYNGNYLFIGPPPPPPTNLTVTIAPNSTTIDLGQSVLFTSNVTGGSPPYTMFQWFLNSTPVPGATLNSWIYTPTASGSDTVYLNATDSKPTTAQSNTITLTVLPPPPLNVLINSSTASIYQGQSASFNSNANGGIPPYNYQWYENDTAIPTATTTSLTFTPGTTGFYLVYLNVTDKSGTTAQSNIETLTVLPPLSGTKIFVDPPETIDLSMGPGSILSINISLANVTSLGGCVFTLTYDPHVLTWIGFDFLPAGGEYPTAIITGNTTAGLVWMSLYYSTPFTIISEPLARLRFYVNSYGISLLNLSNTELLDQDGNPITHNEFGGIFANIIRDVAVTNVVPASSWIYQTWIENINVTVANLGNATESFNATAWYDGTAVGTVSIIGLAPNAQTTVTIPWDTTGVPQGNYTITGTASYVPFETYFNTANNKYVDGTVEVLTIIHDVAITNITPTMAWAYANSTLPIDVTAANLGNASENFTVTAYYNGSTIDTMPVTNLAPNSSTILTLNWNTTGITNEGYYTLSALASLVPFEYNTTNNYLVDGQVLILTQIRDVAITNVTASRAWAYQGGTINITVTASNTGEVSESFNVMAFYDANMLGNVSIIGLAPGASVNEVFTLNTTGLTLCTNYTVSGQASIVPYEYNMTNNVFVDGTITVRLVGDVNGDGKVDIRDIAIVAKAFAAIGPGYLYPGSPPSPNWNPDADLNYDNKIDIRDISIVAKHFGQTCP